MKDQEIVENIRDGNAEKAVSKLYSQLGTFRRFVKGSGGTKEEADDIFQEALIVFCRKVSKPDFVLSAAVNTYLLAIAKYMWMDARRKKNKAEKVDLVNIENVGEEIEAENQEIKSLDLATEAIKNLGERCLELLENFYFRKMSMKEIAEKMKFSSEKITKNQKYKCLERAREKLRQAQGDKA
ncbi:MAG: sigma-70 family RNA polymerase sigma factor [Bacteroidia bacterium]|nr:sigma-70 family RNA polymerase sigma factor [Bacteroidia bacterium]